MLVWNQFWIMAPSFAVIELKHYYSGLPELGEVKGNKDPHQILTNQLTVFQPEG